MEPEKPEKPAENKQYRQVRRSPARKVQVSTAAAALATILLWALGEYTTVEPSAEATAAFVTLVVFFSGYVTPPSSKDQIVPKQEAPPQP